MTLAMTLKADVLRFWFDESGRDHWFRKDDAFDDLLRRRFVRAVEEAAAGRYDDWADDPSGAVALCILLDQFPRNLFRGSARAFAHDGKALSTARRTVERGLDRDPGLGSDQRAFLYMPFMHSESEADQRTCLRLMRERVGDPESVDAAERHLEIVARFGRFPHRNAALGRASTEEELAFLARPGSGF